MSMLLPSISSATDRGMEIRYFALGPRYQLLSRICILVKIADLENKFIFSPMFLDGNRGHESLLVDS